MPISEYFKGRGRKVLQAMKDKYGEKKGESVFHATAKKQDMEPGEKGNTEKEKKENPRSERAKEAIATARERQAEKRAEKNK